jgi:pyruvate dehydrogenase E2 component (dihydrolipoamide acetyltransferase)
MREIMAKILDMPKLSPTMEEGQISTWHKKVGDPVAVDDLLAEVETDKATMEYRAFDKGRFLFLPRRRVVKLGSPSPSWRRRVRPGAGRQGRR